MPRLPPLEPSLEPLDIWTSRRVYIQNLANLLHASIVDRDRERAQKCWAILLRCPEIDIRLQWKWGLAVLDLRPTATEDKEKFLRRMQVTVGEDTRPEILLHLILHLISTKQYSRAMDELELYLPSHPYIRSSILHVYAGLLLFYLAQPVALRERVEQLASQAGQSAGPSQSAQKERENTPSTSSSASDFSSPRAPPRAKVAFALDQQRLRKALGYFRRSIEIDLPEDNHEGHDHDLPPLRTQNVTAEYYIAQIDAYLSKNGSSDLDDDDEYAHYRSPTTRQPTLSPFRLTSPTSSIHSKANEYNPYYFSPSPSPHRGLFSPSGSQQSLHHTPSSSRASTPRPDRRRSNRTPTSSSRQGRAADSDQGSDDSDRSRRRHARSRVFPDPISNLAQPAPVSLAGLGAGIGAMQLQSSGKTSGASRPSLVSDDKEEDLDSEANKSEYSDDLSVG